MEWSWKLNGWKREKKRCWNSTTESGVSQDQEKGPMQLAYSKYLVFHLTCMALKKVRLRSLLKFKLHSANSANSRCHPRQKTCIMKFLYCCLFTFQQMQNRENANVWHLCISRTTVPVWWMGDSQTNNNRTTLFILKYVEPFTRNGLSSKSFTIPVVSEWDCEVQSSDSTQDFLASPGIDLSVQPKAT